MTNADLTKAETFSSDIKGSCNLYNNRLENIVITLKHKSLASLIEGSYDIDKQEAEINVYGKYDMHAPKGVKILFIPLNWIINFVLKNEEPQNLYQQKLDKIPPIECGQEHEEYFKINVKGNINTEQISVDIKGLQ